MRWILTPLALFALASSPLAAAEVAGAKTDTTTVPSDTAAADKEDEDEDPTFAKLVQDCRRIEGLFDLYVDDDEGQVYLALRPDQFNAIHLCDVTRTQGDGFFFDAAAQVEVGLAWGGFPIVFARAGKRVLLKHANVYYRAEPDAAIRRAVERLSDSVLGSAQIECQPDPETGAVLVDPTGFFVRDIAMVSYLLGELNEDLSYELDDETSYFGDLSGYPDNTELDVVLTFTTSKPKVVIPTVPDSRSFQHVYHYSLSRVPASDFQPRRGDDRVGHFLTLYQDYTSALTSDPYVRYVDRWHLEKAEPRFEVSRPKQPIVFWLENTVPVEYRDAVREGILLWNDAFARIGFQDAIVVQQQPDAADWDAADVRYSTVRWIVQPGQAYAVGPSRANPFTGQIYDADIRISADFVRYAYREFTELADPLTRPRLATGDSLGAALGVLGRPGGMCSMAEGLVQEAAFGWHVLRARTAADGSGPDLEAYLRQLLVELVAHEVGHTLGLRHNFKASTVHANGSVGISGSVMDYNPVNLAPEGQDQGDYYMTHLGPYDFWAIDYAYRPLDADSGASQERQLAQIAERAAQPELAYGTDEDAFYGTEGIDPLATRWDLGADAIAHVRDMVAVSHELWAKMEDRFERQGERYQTLNRVFGWGFRPYASGVGNVARYVGGIYHHRDHVGDPAGRTPFVPVPAARQREALAFITDQVLGPDAFHWSPELLNKLAPERWQDFTWSQYFGVRRIERPIHEIVLDIQRQPLNRFYDPLLLQRLQDLQLRFAADEEPFTMAELFASLRQAIWAEVGAGRPVHSFRRNLQREHLRHLEELALRLPPGTPEDARSLARADLEAIAAGIDAADLSAVDAATQAHLRETRARIGAILGAGLQRQL